MARWLKFVVVFALLFGACEEKFESPKGATVKGIVADHLSGKGLYGVKVSTIPSYKFTNTDSNGYFIIENLCPRTYRLVTTLNSWSDTLLDTLSQTIIDTVSDSLLVDSMVLTRILFNHSFPNGTTDVFELKSGELKDLDTLFMVHLIDTVFDTLFLVDTIPGG